MEPLPFRALWTTDPWGVLSFDLNTGFRLWRAADWLRRRGGLRVHYDDVASARTIMVDHLEFAPRQRPGLGYDALGRRIVHVTLAMVLGIAFSRDGGIDERYLRRCFSRDDAHRIMEVAHAYYREAIGQPLAFCEAVFDLNAAILGRTDGVCLIR